MNTPPLGVMDWGIGGLSVYTSIKERAPRRPVLYFSDSGATPYGHTSRHELAARVAAVLRWMAGHGVRRVVVACNAASTVLADVAGEARGAGIEGILGMIEPAVRGIVRMRTPALGLIGGARTVRSGMYRARFVKAGIDVHQRIAQPLSGHIEAGDVSSDELRTTTDAIVRPLRRCSHLLLACTHYPAIAPMLQDLLPGVRIIDPAAFVVRELAASGALDVGGTPGPDVFFTTGDAATMKRAASAAFGVTIARVRTAVL